MKVPQLRSIDRNGLLRRWDVLIRNWFLDDVAVS